MPVKESWMQEVDEVLALSPEMVRKTSYNFSAKTYNRMAKLYTQVLLAEAVYIILDEKPGWERLKAICDKLRENPEYYYYEEYQNRLSKTLKESVGDNPQTREAGIAFKNAKNQITKKFYCDMYDVVKAFMGTATYGDKEAIFRDAKGFKYYDDVLNILASRAKYEELKRETEELQKENERLKTFIKRDKQFIEKEAVQPPKKKNFLSNVLAAIKGRG